MKIFFPAWIRFPLGHGNGLQTVRTADALARAGAEVRLFVRVSDPRPTDEILRDFYGVKNQTKNLTIARLRDPISKPGKPCAAWAPAVAQGIFFARVFCRIFFTPGEKIIFTRSLREAALWLRLRHILRVKIFYEAHAIAADEILERAKNLGESAAKISATESQKLRALEGKIYRGVSGIVAITAGLRDEIARQFGVDPGKIAVVPDAFDLPKILPKKCPGADRRAIVISALFPWKGVDDLLRAIPAAPALDRLIVIGGAPDPGADPDRARLEDLAKKLGTQDRVEFRGFLPAPVAFAQTGDAEIAILSNAPGKMSEIFTSPLKLFGYLAHGLAVVAPDFPSMREILRDGENALLFDPVQPGDLAEKVSRLLGDQNLREKISATGRRDAEKFTWEARGQRIFEFFARGAR